MTRHDLQGRGFRSRSRIFWTVLVVTAFVLLGVALFLVFGRRGYVPVAMTHPILLDAVDAVSGASPPPEPADAASEPVRGDETAFEDDD